jgi:hypothetical protein
MQFHRGSTRVREHHIHSFALESFDKDVGSLHGGTMLALDFGVRLSNGLGIHDILIFKRVINMSNRPFFFKVKELYIESDPET